MKKVHNIRIQGFDHYFPYKDRVFDRRSEKMNEETNLVNQNERKRN